MPNPAKWFIAAACALLAGVIAGGAEAESARPPQALLDAMFPKAKLESAPSPELKSVLALDPAPETDKKCGLQKWNLTQTRGTSTHVFKLLGTQPPTGQSTFLFGLQRLTVDADGSARAYHPDDAYGVGICTGNSSSSACALDNLASARVRLFQTDARVPLKIDRKPNPKFLPAWSSIWTKIKNRKIDRQDLTAILGANAPKTTAMFYDPETITGVLFDTAITEFDGNYPCLQKNNGGYFVAETSFRLKSTKPTKACDTSRYLDAVKTPFFVIPRDTFKTISVGDLAIGWAIKGDQIRYAFGIVGDTGPIDHLAEGSIAFVSKLRALTKQPMNSKDTDDLDIDLSNKGSEKPPVDKMAVLVFGSTASKLKGDFSASNIEKAGRAELANWSKQAGSTSRLSDCANLAPANPHEGFVE